MAAARSAAAVSMEKCATSCALLANISWSIQGISQGPGGAAITRKNNVDLIIAVGGGAVIAKAGEKRSSRDFPQLNPRFALMDPAYTYSVPKLLMASGSFSVSEADSVANDLMEALDEEHHSQSAHGAA